MLKCEFVLILFYLPFIWSFEGKIVGGNPVDVSGHEPQFPFAVAVYVTKYFDNVTYFCGGTLVEDLWVITAASCIEDAKVIRVDAGSYHLRSIDPNRVSIFCYYYEIHPDYNSDTAENDIAIVKIPKKPPNNGHIQSVERITINPPTVGANITLFGWGLTFEGPNEGLSNDLRYVNMSVLSAKECTDFYKDEFKEDSMFCASGKKFEGACRGDIGGGVIYYMNGHHPTLLGISSFLHKKGCEKGPSGYTKARNYQGWIDNVIGPSRAQIDNKYTPR